MTMPFRVKAIRAVMETNRSGRFPDQAAQATASERTIDWAAKALRTAAMRSW